MENVEGLTLHIAYKNDLEGKKSLEMIPCHRALEYLRNLSNELKVTVLLRLFEAIRKP